MKNQFIFLILLVLFPLTLVAESSTKAQLNALEQNSLVIYELPQSIIVVKVVKKEASRVTLDVVSTTKDVLEREQLASWMAWCQAGTPSATMRDTIIISLPNGDIIQRGSSMQGEWLITLLRLDMKKVPVSARKRAGPQPMPDEQDFRKPWQPKVIVQGKRLETTSTAYSVSWPEDGSILAKRDIILYFPDSAEAVRGFPYWIESPTSSYKVFVADSTRSFS